MFLTNYPLSFQNTCAITTGLSDFHKMVITVMKMTFQKTPPREIYYRGYKKFDQQLFKEGLSNEINRDVFCYETFEQIFMNVLNKHAPFKNRW